MRILYIFITHTLFFNAHIFLPLYFLILHLASFLFPHILPLIHFYYTYNVFFIYFAALVSNVAVSIRANLNPEAKPKSLLLPLYSLVLQLASFAIL